jgi:hypothetical protein
LFALVLCAAAGCATSSAANYSVSYATVGSVNETGPANEAAKAAFDRDITPERQQGISAVKIFMDSVPAEVSLRDNVVSVAEGSSAKLVGSVEVSAVWKAPDDDAAALPALQRAAEAAGANLAFCPRTEQTLGHWRCHLLKTSP